jgi:hypothetical protein
MNKVLITIALFFAGITVASAKGNASVTVHVNNKALCTEQLYMLLQKEYIYNHIGATELVAKADLNGDFVFKINNLDHFKIFQLEFADLPMIYSYIEEGDHIRITYTGSREKLSNDKDYIFSGKGADKLQLAHMLMWSGPNIPPNLSSAGYYNHSQVDSLIDWGSSVCASQMKILKSFGERISGQMIQMYTAEIFANSYLPVLSYFDFAPHQKRLDSTLVRYLIDGIERKQPNLDPSIIAENREYIQFIAKKSSCYARYQRGAGKGKNYELTSIDLTLRNAGVVREKALLYFISSDGRFRYSDGVEAVYQNALSLISETNRKLYLEELVVSRKEGEQAFDFSMSDINGDTIRLHDFKNKIVVIEGWFLGCEACFGLAKTIKAKVLPEFINNPDVVFLTINADKLKQRWLHGVKTGQYTNNKSINLFTGGLGMNHPFINYYKFQAMPFLMLLGRDQKLISTNIRGTGEQIADKIRNALK